MSHLRIVRGLVATAATFLVAAGAAAAPPCTFIADARSGEVLVQEGACGDRVTAASTFKIPLSLIGFDTGYLKDAHAPALPYRDDYKAMMESWKITTDPTVWLEDSVVWYSQVMTEALGLPKLQGYVDGFAYGNRDLSGGLTRAWLSSSLQISPAEQVAFLRRMLAGRLPVAPRAVAMTKAIMPRFEAADGWIVWGKTGSGLQRGRDGKNDRDRQVGWFVGWTTRGARTAVFAYLVRDDDKAEDRAGIRAREQFIDALPKMMAGVVAR